MIKLILQNIDGKVRLSDEKGNVLGWLPLESDDKRKISFVDTIFRFLKGESVPPQENETQNYNSSSANKRKGKKPSVTYDNQSGVIEVDGEFLANATSQVASFLSGLSRK